MAAFFFCLIQSFQRDYNRKLEYKRQMSCRAKIFTAGKAVLGNNIPGKRGNWKRVSEVKNGGLINLLLIHKRIILIILLVRKKWGKEKVLETL